MDVPLPLAASRRLMSFLTFHISMFFSASVPLGALMMMLKGRTRALPSKGGGQNAVLDLSASELEKLWPIRVWSFAWRSSHR